jgi:sugar (pentulose or hexulose) kinase
VVYLPYLAGEQAPYRDPNARAGWFYISRKTFRSELYRSVLEGVAYSMRAIQMLMPEPPGEQPIRLRLIGNESATPLWAQIFADVFDCPVELLTPADDVTARGAAFYALRGLDPTVGDRPRDAYIHIQNTYFPKYENVEIYDRMFGVFCRLYPALVGSFKEMAEQEA